MSGTIDTAIVLRAIDIVFDKAMQAPFTVGAVASDAFPLLDAWARMCSREGPTSGMEAYTDSCEKFGLYTLSGGTAYSVGCQEALVFDYIRRAFSIELKPPVKELLAVYADVVERTDVCIVHYVLKSSIPLTDEARPCRRVLESAVRVFGIFANKLTAQVNPTTLQDDLGIIGEVSSFLAPNLRRPIGRLVTKVAYDLLAGVLKNEQLLFELQRIQTQIDRLMVEAAWENDVVAAIVAGDMVRIKRAIVPLQELIHDSKITVGSATDHMWIDSIASSLKDGLQHRISKINRAVATGLRIKFSEAMIEMCEEAVGIQTKESTLKSITDMLSLIVSKNLFLATEEADDFDVLSAARQSSMTLMKSMIEMAADGFSIVENHKDTITAFIGQKIADLKLSNAAEEAMASFVNRMAGLCRDDVKRLMVDEYAASPICLICIPRCTASTKVDKDLSAFIVAMLKHLSACSAEKVQGLTTFVGNLFTCKYIELSFSGEPSSSDLELQIPCDEIGESGRNLALHLTHAVWLPALVDAVHVAVGCKTSTQNISAKLPGNKLLAELVRVAKTIPTFETKIDDCIEVIKSRVVPYVAPDVMNSTVGVLEEMKLQTRDALRSKILEMMKSTCDAVAQKIKKASAEVASIKPPLTDILENLPLKPSTTDMLTYLASPWVQTFRKVAPTWHRSSI